MSYLPHLHMKPAATVQSCSRRLTFHYVKTDKSVKRAFPRELECALFDFKYCQVMQIFINMTFIKEFDFLLVTSNTWISIEISAILIL